MNLLRSLVILLGLLVLLALVALDLPAGFRGAGLDPAIRRPGAVLLRELDPGPGELVLPLRDGSVRFAAIGDSGRGDRAQQEVADQMAAWRTRFPFDFVLMLGDNIYDSHTAADYVRKFARPYRALLDAGVTFHAALGNHDDPAQVFYVPFNMSGQRYYTFRRSERRLAGFAGAGARFYALDSRSLDPHQLEWLRRELSESGSAWKIVFLHHPLYTSGRYRGGARALRLALEPILVAGDVDVVLAGHEHVYERLQPQRGIFYFVSGGAGSLRPGDLQPSTVHARGFDRDYHFMLFELSGPELFFQAISRTGETVDAGMLLKGEGTREKGQTEGQGQEAR